MPNPFYAHSSPDGRLQTLDEHLEGVAKQAQAFAQAFGSGNWGRWAGALHDLGKMLPGFQARLAGESRQVEHSGVGAALAFEKDQRLGLLLAFVVAGHHGGLPDLQQSEGGLSSLLDRLAENRAQLDAVRPDLPGAATATSLPSLPTFLTAATPTDVDPAKRRTEFWVRFIFSCLVDADWLDTEAFARPSMVGQRGRFPSVSELCHWVDSFIEQKTAGLGEEGRQSSVNRVRAEVLEQCRRAAGQPPGTFSLTVPTGGGKTLSAMAFALQHAERHGLERVIVVIPYTSIIEQNAREYRLALGAENVIEHHSNLDPDSLSKEHGQHVARATELASENWDAPVIVTTSVQFFESLFANRPWRCRKLHNVARSVIVLDEVQALPPGFLLSILDALNELVAHYGCSVVLSTATPPALAARERWEFGLRNVQPIIQDSVDLALRLQRVEYEWPAIDAESTPWPELARALAAHERAL